MVVSKHRRARSGPVVAFLLAALALSVGLPSTAHAGGSRLALDLDYAHGIDEPSVTGGKGAALRYGYKIGLPIVSLTPEVGAGLYGFGKSNEPMLVNGFLGGRASFFKGLEPGVFAHIGYGSMKGAGDGVGVTTLDFGIALDVTVVPLIDFGVHGAYDALLIKDSDAFDWYRVGAHAALAF